MSQEPNSADGEHAAGVAWIKHVRRLHRNKRIIGFAGIVLGTSMLMWWKFDAATPGWALGVGMGVMAASWALFIYVIAARWKWVKDNPYHPPTK